LFTNDLLNFQKRNNYSKHNTQRIHLHTHYKNENIKQNSNRDKAQDTIKNTTKELAKENTKAKSTPLMKKQESHILSNKVLCCGVSIRACHKRP